MAKMVPSSRLNCEQQRQVGYPVCLMARRAAGIARIEAVLIAKTIAGRDGAKAL
jgi:hypothetical protein